MIEKKRQGLELSSEEVSDFVNAVVAHNEGAIQESQIGAMLMAMYLKGLSLDETVTLTQCMINSGSTLGPYPEQWRHLVVDKHSTGGIGDKISIVLAPALMACGAKVPMISGRGLGHTGGTLDKLESIKGYKTGLPPAKIMQALESIGGVICGQTGDLCPADRVLYAHRDITATVTSIPLICASIISKKIAERLNSLVLDVKFGSGGQLTNVENARELAQSLVNLANSLGTKTTAFLTNNDNPLGLTAGNAVEIAECVECLQKGSLAKAKDVVHVVQVFGGHLLASVGIASTFEDGKAKILQALNDGSALKSFHQMCVFTGVDKDYADKLIAGENPTEFLCQPKYKTELKAKNDGFIDVIDARTVGLTLQRLGAGRLQSSDIIDPAVGLQLTLPYSPCRGHQLKKGDTWGLLLHNGQATQKDVDILEDALKTCDEKPAGSNPDDLVFEMVQ